MRSDRSRKGRIVKTAAALLVALLLSGTGPAVAENYESKRSGHPLRILAYIVHPIGVIVDTLIFRPLHLLGSKDPVKTLVGQQDK
jgi:hypothetical protein